MITTWDDFVRDADREFGPIEPDTLSIVSDIILQAVVRRIDLGWTQARLAEEAGLKQAAVSRLESFAVVPRLDTLVRVLKALGLRLSVSPVETGGALVDSSHTTYDVGENCIDGSEDMHPVLDVFISVPNTVIAEELFYEVDQEPMGVAA